MMVGTDRLLPQIVRTRSDASERVRGWRPQRLAAPLGQKLAQRVLPFVDKLDEAAALIVRIVMADNDTLLLETIQVSECRRWGHTRSQTERRCGHVSPIGIGDQQFEQHVPCGIPEQSHAEDVVPAAPKALGRPSEGDGIGERRRIAAMPLKLVNCIGNTAPMLLRERASNI
jgi:hypothetical protein